MLPQKKMNLKNLSLVPPSTPSSVPFLSCTDNPWSIHICGFKWHLSLPAQIKMEEKHIPFFPRRTAQSLDGLYKTSVRRLWKQERGGREAVDIGIWGTTWQWIPWVFFLLHTSRTGCWRSSQHRNSKWTKGKTKCPQKKTNKKARTKKTPTNQTKQISLAKAPRKGQPGKKRILL